jgi:hypothetical protein
VTDRDYNLATNLARLYDINRTLREMVFPTPTKKLDKAHYMPGACDNAIEAVERLMSYHQYALGLR